VPRRRRGTFAPVGCCGEEKGCGEKESPQQPPFSLARPEGAGSLIKNLFFSIYKFLYLL